MISHLQEVLNDSLKKEATSRTNDDARESRRKSKMTLQVTYQETSLSDIQDLASPSGAVKKKCSSGHASSPLMMTWLKRKNLKRPISQVVSTTSEDVFKKPKIRKMPTKKLQVNHNNNVMKKFVSNNVTSTKNDLTEGDTDVEEEEVPEAAKPRTPKSSSNDVAEKLPVLRRTDSTKPHVLREDYKPSSSQDDTKKKEIEDFKRRRKEETLKNLQRQSQQSKVSFKSEFSKDHDFTRKQKIKEIASSLRIGSDTPSVSSSSSSKTHIIHNMEEDPSQSRDTPSSDPSRIVPSEHIDGISKLPTAPYEPSTPSSRKSSRSSIPSSSTPSSRKSSSISITTSKKSSIISSTPSKKSSSVQSTPSKKSSVSNTPSKKPSSISSTPTKKSSSASSAPSKSSSSLKVDQDKAEKRKLQEVNLFGSPDDMFCKKPKVKAKRIPRIVPELKKEEEEDDIRGSNVEKKRKKVTWASENVLIQIKHFEVVAEERSEVHKDSYEERRRQDARITKIRDDARKYKPKVEDAAQDQPVKTWPHIHLLQDPRKPSDVRSEEKMIQENREAETLPFLWIPGVVVDPSEDASIHQKR